jgi:hypothetical protein
VESNIDDTIACSSGFPAAAPCNAEYAELPGEPCPSSTTQAGISADYPRRVGNQGRLGILERRLRALQKPPACRDRRCEDDRQRRKHHHFPFRPSRTLKPFHFIIHRRVSACTCF